MSALRLTPLGVEHAEQDYEAVMASRAFLRAWSGTTWPADDFTLDQNRADLDRHAREHAAGEAWTWTVFEGELCVGCVYTDPIAKILKHRRIEAEAPEGWCVAFWARSDRIELEGEILAHLRDWLPRDRPQILPLRFFTSAACGQGARWAAAGLRLESAPGPFEIYR